VRLGSVGFSVLMRRGCGVLMEDGLKVSLSVGRSWRLLGVLTVASLVACGDHELAEETTALGASALEENYVGDHGPGWDAPATDPTKDPDFSLADDPIIEKAPERAVLEYKWLGQPNGYWCGPASTRIALSTRLTELPAQPVLADFLGTTTEGTARADVISALNTWLTPHTPYESIPVDGRPTQAQRDLLKRNLVWRISTGFPVVANVLSGWRPPGYPTGTIGHFVAVVGYEQRGEKVLIADPAAEGSAGPRWENVPRTYWISFQNLGTWIGGRGYSG
jgi:hypothetical protein